MAAARGRLDALSRHLCTGTTATPAPPGPLHGIRVLDLSQMVSGPMGTQILADMGADVIKIEPMAGAGERGSSQHDKVVTPLFALVNRNKRSVCIDLKREEGLAYFKKLVPTADVIVQNFRPGVADRMGIGYTAMRDLNPKIIYMSISGFGQTGPYAGKRVYDPVIQAVSGLASIQADENGRPRMFRLIVPDKVTALTSAQAITAALVQRIRTGTGAHIDLSMLDAVVSFAWGEGFAQEAVMDGQTPNRTYSRDMVFATADGFITCGAVQDKEWKALCAALDQPAWLTDKRFASRAARSLNRGLRFQMTEDILKTMTTAEAMERLTRHQVPCGVINHPREKVLTDPQVVENKLLHVVDHPWAAFKMQQPRTAARFSSSPYTQRYPAPLLGEHTRDVLAEAGLSRREIEAAEKQGVLKVVGGQKPTPGHRDSRLYDPTSA